MYRRRNRFNLKFRILIVGMLIIAFIIGGFLILEFSFKPTITQVAEVKARLLATEAINKAIYESIISQVNYQDLIYIHKNNNNEITTMQVNTFGIRKIQAQTTLEIQRILEELSGEGFKLPIGQVLGSRLLATYGPKISVKLIPAGTVKVNLIDHFDEAGINQVRHLIYLDIESNVKILVPLFDASTTVATRVPIAETIIVGPVPDAFINLDLGSGLNPRGLPQLFGN
jgi:sporulation protein YunB